MAYDVAETALAPGFRPGERMLHGRPLVTNQDALNAYVADQAIAAPPADLSALSDEDVSGLVGSYLNAIRRRRGDAEVAAFGVRIHAERAKRPALVSAYEKVA